MTTADENRQIRQNLHSFVECHIRTRGKERAEADGLRLLAEKYASEHNMPFEKAFDAIRRIVN